MGGGGRSQGDAAPSMRASAGATVVRARPLSPCASHASAGRADTAPAPAVRSGAGRQNLGVRRAVFETAKPSAEHERCGFVRLDYGCRHDGQDPLPPRVGSRKYILADSCSSFWGVFPGRRASSSSSRRRRHRRRRCLRSTTWRCTLAARVPCAGGKTPSTSHRESFCTRIH